MPNEIDKQFPSEGRKGEDSSPSHITIIYVGELLPVLEKKLVKIVEQVCSRTKPFLVKLKKPRKFINKKGQIILHSPVKSSRLIKFNESLRVALMNNGIQIDDKFPEYKPHITIAYCDSKKELKQYKDIKPEGEWVIDSIWIWSTSQPYLIFLGK